MVENWVWFPAGVVVLGLLYGLYGTRRFRDARLDRTYADDEAAPNDSPASQNPVADQYIRMLDPDGRSPGTDRNRWV